MQWRDVNRYLLARLIASFALVLAVTACTQPAPVASTLTASVPPSPSAQAATAIPTGTSPATLELGATVTPPSTPQGPCKTSYPAEIEPQSSELPGWCAIDNDHVHVVYPDNWIVGLMGAAGQNRRFDTQIAPGITQTVRLAFLATDLPIEQADQAMDGGYELSPSQPLVNPKEIVVARTLITVGDKHSLVLVTHWDGYAIKRYFVVDHQTLLEFSVTATIADIDAQPMQRLFATVEQVISRLQVQPFPAKGSVLGIPRI